MKRNIDRYNLPRYEIQKAIDQWIFCELDRKLLSDRLLDGMTLEELSAKHEISVGSVKNRLYKSLDKLEKRL